MKTLITGAGASMDVCKAFKNGETLLNDIYKLISLDEEFRSQLQKDGYSFEVLNLFCNELKSFREYGHRKSIDEFIGEFMTFPEYESQTREQLIKIGKYCIIYSILIMEDAFLKSYSELNHKENWIDIFKKEFERNGNYKIITFNYDRLLEYLIFKGDSQTINHVYGTIRLEHWDFGRIPKSIKDFEKPDGKTHLGDFLIVNDRVKYPKSSGQIGFDHVAGQLQKWNGVIGFGFDFFNIRNVGLLNHAPGRKTYANLYDKNQIAVNFEDRRTKTDEVRRMVPDANFSYLSCIEFIKYFISLNDENS